MNHTHTSHPHKLKSAVLILLISILSFSAFVAHGQKTRVQLKTLIDQIRNETATGANTNARIADVLQFIVDSTQPVIIPVPTTGTNTYAADPAISTLISYIKGQTFLIQFVNRNTGASTINLKSLGVKNLIRPGGTSLQSGDLLANSSYFIWYNGASFEVLNLWGTGGGPPITSITVDSNTITVDSSTITVDHD